MARWGNLFWLIVGGVIVHAFAQTRVSGELQEPGKLPAKPISSFEQPASGKGNAVPAPLANVDGKAEIFEEIRFVNATSLRVRSGPSTSEGVVGNLLPADRLVIEGSEGEWLRITAPNGQKGWVHQDYVSREMPERVPKREPMASRPAAVASTRSARDRDVVARRIVERSMDSYAGSCPCPYSRDRAGRSCGRRSAYVKPGGASPLCYTEDVTDQMIEAFR